MRIKDNLSGNNIASGNNTTKFKGNNITNNYSTVKLTKNDKLEFASKVAETKYEVDALKRKILNCIECSPKIKILINDYRNRCRSQGVCCLIDDITILINYTDWETKLCPNCMNNIEELKKKTYLLETYNQMLKK